MEVLRKGTHIFGRQSSVDRVTVRLSRDFSATLQIFSIVDERRGN